MIYPSATLDNVDVKDMGLRSLLKSSIDAPLGTGGTSASFHGSVVREIRVFHISDEKIHRIEIPRLSKSPLIFFLVGFASLKDFSLLFGAKFTGGKFNR